MLLSTFSISLYHHIMFESVLYINIFICVLFGIIFLPMASVFFHKDAPRDITESAVIGFTTTGYVWAIGIISVIYL